MKIAAFILLNLVSITSAFSQCNNAAPKESFFESKEFIDAAIKQGVSIGLSEEESKAKYSHLKPYLSTFIDSTTISHIKLDYLCIGSGIGTISYLNNSPFIQTYCILPPEGMDLESFINNQLSLKTVKNISISEFSKWKIRRFSLKYKDGYYEVAIWSSENPKINFKPQIKLEITDNTYYVNKDENCEK